MAVTKGPRFEVTVEVSPVPYWAYAFWAAEGRTAEERGAIVELWEELAGDPDLFSKAVGKYAMIVNGKLRKELYDTPAIGLQRVPADATVVVLRVDDGQPASNLFVALQRTGALHKTDVAINQVSSDGTLGRLIARGKYVIDLGADTTTMAGVMDTDKTVWRSVVQSTEEPVSLFSFPSLEGYRSNQSNE